MITYRTLTEADVLGIAHVHRFTRLACFNFMKEPHAHTYESDIQFFLGEITPKCQLLGAFARDALVGYLALSPGWIEHLYVLPGWHGERIGSHFIDHAKSLQVELRLWVFQKNKARSFYEHHGFTCEALHDGSNNMEKEPDAVYHWRRAA